MITQAANTCFAATSISFLLCDRIPSSSKMRSPEQQLQQQIEASLSLESVQNQLTVVIPKSSWSHPTAKRSGGR
ncbi:hypothetical protein H6F50_14955 [Coleofasciculus sp. FACHB-712]|uniref:hypothetical protein n=1 Tax=Coleofasciculus sp. FACHB-712 TaxID=2692789 RepID=UPI001683232B|nr:hypothetical protein [Coleofasciculus sp. FACHB-712]MBD1943641.1 hypothetical protein [Coleofasciculus sp. FACHB-712]